MFAYIISINFADSNHVWCIGCDKCGTFGAVC